MPPLPNVPGVVRFVLEGTSSTRNWANVFHVQYTGAAPSLESLTGLCSGWGDANLGGIVELMDTETTIVQSVATDLASNTGNQAEAAIGVPGTRTGTPLPASAAFLVNYNSSFRYRGGHPRTYYLFGVAADLLNQSTWTSAFLDAAGPVAAAVTSSFAAGTIDGTTYTSQCAVSYKENNEPRVAPLVMPIGATFPQGGLASQRRRMRKG